MFRLLSLLLLFTLPAQAEEIWVTHLTDDTDTANGTCNLREAIRSANDDAGWDACPAGSGTDTIYFAKTGSVQLIIGLPTIDTPLNIIGPGTHLLTIDANGFDRVLNFDATGPMDFTVSGVTLTGGMANEGGGVRFEADDDATLTLTNAVVTGNEAVQGGGIWMRRGALTLEQVTVSNNEATGTGSSGGGGGIYGAFSTSGGALGTINIYNSTVSGNETAFSGGGIRTYTDATIRSSTFSGNMADSGGGGISARGTQLSAPNIDIQYTTITNNTAAADLSIGDSGGLTVSNNAILTLKSTIISDNIDADPTPLFYNDVDISSGITVTSLGYNLIGTNNGATTAFPEGNPNANGDYVGTNNIPLPADLDPLADYGGPTHTHRPRSSSRHVLDRGSCAGEDTDQRGWAGDDTTPNRVFDMPGIPNDDDGCDVGAYEVMATAVPAKLNLKVLLDGPYTNVLMHTDLNAAGLLPLTQPYTAAPWNYGGFETLLSVPTDMVDWVLVTLYQGGPLDAGGLTPIVTRAYTLEDNGDVNEPDIFSDLNISSGFYYIAVDHRNHLPIMSAGPVYFKWGQNVTYEFHTALSKAYTAGGTALRDRGGLFTMWGGDGDANGSTSAFDFLNAWLPINGGPPGYIGGDFNMDGSGTAFDFLTIWLPANGQSSQVP